jgi:hypothetical protein
VYYRHPNCRVAYIAQHHIEQLALYLGKTAVQVSGVLIDSLDEVRRHQVQQLNQIYTITNCCPTTTSSPYHPGLFHSLHLFTQPPVLHGGAQG